MQEILATKMDGKYNTASKLTQPKVTELLSVKLPCESENFIAKINGDLDKLNTVTIKIITGKDNAENGIDLSDVLSKYCKKEYPKTLNPRTKWILSFTMDTDVDDLPTGLDKLEKKLKSKGFYKVKFLIIKAGFIVKNNIFYFDNTNATGALTLKAINNNKIGKMDKKQQTELLQGDLAFCAPSQCYLRYRQEVICQ